MALTLTQPRTKTAAQLATEEREGHAAASRLLYGTAPASQAKPSVRVTSTASSGSLQRKTPSPTLRTGVNMAQQNPKYGEEMADSPLPQWVVDALVDAGKGYLVRGGVSSTPTFEEGAEIDVMSQAEAKQYAGRRRRRRRRLLTSSDKSDIAFLHGQLGSGQLGRAAISALLSRRC